MDLLQALKKQFGFDRFLPGQKEIIEAILEKKDAVAIFPTGQGKSLCYQLPATLFQGLTIVISPLIALMEDQLQGLEKIGICGALIHGQMELYEQIQVVKNLDKIKVLLISPERLKDRFLREKLIVRKPSLFVVDEAHCITTWGQSFREEYLNLHLIKELFPDVPILALTATADKTVEKDIIRHLFLKNPVVHRLKNTFHKKKLIVMKREGPFRDILLKESGAGIIFTQTKASADELYFNLKSIGFNALQYHAGLTKEERKESAQKFLVSEDAIMVATKAFGMGIDKPNIRFVIHTSMPSSLEDYLQEIGRAGRDGGPSTCYLLYKRIDYFRLKRLLSLEIDGIFLERAIHRLDLVYKYCVGRTCRVQLITQDENENECGLCDNCLIKNSFWRRLFKYCNM